MKKRTLRRKHKNEVQSSLSSFFAVIGSLGSLKKEVGSFYQIDINTLIRVILVGKYYYYTIRKASLHK